METVTSHNTALTQCRKLLGHGDEVDRVVYSRDNPARLSLPTRSHSLYLSLSGSLMQKR